ncbi:MAG: NrfD/PsrC family molybdoenzyme membrane anchor subunit [Candidatus Promineifilaceae bacterium]|nr:NrfD/PsrC family molybdoenzyme membrane anchor subunit [Candidatus Promineifilaceae bacterium]
MNYGFVIDNRKCIGCHACSTACKSENEVPLGVYRTWVKYVETGTFPNTRRHFQVTRCNHCANPPCVRICPVTAMYQRDDGIVDFDSSICIGCKACMQACPYDAIYIDPETDTAAKCHYCAHRTEIGLEPACVVVCPEHAIISGDMDDPGTEISHLLASQDVTVRKPEQGTSPKVFYIDGNAASLVPTAVERAPETFMWADVIPLHAGEGLNGNGHGRSHGGVASPNGRSAAPKQSKSGAPLRTPQPQGTPWDGPIQFGGTMAEHMVQVAYNAQHKIPWHWPVPAYLVTKGIGAGLFLLLAVGVLFNLFNWEPVTYLVGGFLSLLFTGITTALLVYDLDKPERFFSILLRPQWRSWLARGAFILVGFSIVAGLWWLIELGAYYGVLAHELANLVRPWAMAAGSVLAVGAAVYTAYLFAQAEGRDLWQSPLLPFHLVVQALMAGSGLMLVVALFLPTAPDRLIPITLTLFAASVAVDLFITLVGEFSIPHASEIAARAAHEISHGRYKNTFWYGSIALGHLLPLLLAGLWFWATEAPVLGAVAGLAAIVGLYLFEYAFVMAPQEIPNS